MIILENPTKRISFLVGEPSSQKYNLPIRCSLDRKRKQVILLVVGMRSHINKHSFGVHFKESNCFCNHQCVQGERRRISVRDDR